MRGVRRQPGHSAVPSGTCSQSTVTPVELSCPACSSQWQSGCCCSSNPSTVRAGRGEGQPLVCSARAFVKPCRGFLFLHHGQEGSGKVRALGHLACQTQQGVRAVGQAAQSVWPIDLGNLDFQRQEPHCEPRTYQRAFDDEAPRGPRGGPSPAHFMGLEMLRSPEPGCFRGTAFSAKPVTGSPPLTSGRAWAVTLRQSHKRPGNRQAWCRQPIQLFIFALSAGRGFWLG